jgi:acetylornithine deacetylase
MTVHDLVSGSLLDPGAELNETEARLLRSIDNQRAWMEDLLLRLMAARSIPGREHEAQTIVESVLRDLGLDLSTVPMEAETLRASALASPFDHDITGKYNVVGHWTPPGVNGRSLTLSGHVDVLHPPAPSLWSMPPFSPRVQEGEIVGWGALKAGLVAMLGAVRAIRLAGLEPAGQLRIQSVVEEEIGGNGAVATNLALPPLDGALVAGCAGETVAVAQVGVVWVEITVVVPPAHAAAGDHTESALDKALSIARMLEATSARRAKNPPESFRGLPNPLAFNLGLIQAGSLPSLTPDECTIQCRIGSFPGDRPAEVVKRVEEEVRQHADQDATLRAYRPTVRMAGFAASGFELERDAPLVRTAVTAHRKLSLEAILVGSTTATDTRAFVGSGTPAICVGPPVANLHSIEERVDMSALHQAAQKVALIISEWSGLTCTSSRRDSDSR